ncbi:diguanylate cyclase [Clostridium novyi A str. 4570]|uniref:Diguanylate cyclase n=1 Tax=Clostridium novyi A str. 4570 TaxID=1444290 RepID=A0AA88ZTT4_CLONO|nr:EAL domain-containing protein [Clostridium novyi]KGN03031.1 diguanylate cyclase [Clostridium novyi A str. 4570]
MKYAFFLLLLISFLIYFLTGIYILKKDGKSTSNKVFFSLCAVTSFWALGYAGMLVGYDMRIVNFFRIVASIGWCFLHGIWLEFAIVTSKGGNYKLSHKYKGLIYLFPVIFFIRNSLHEPRSVLINTDIGWVDICPIDWMFPLLVLYFMCCILGGIFIIYRWGKNSKKNREKKQAVIINSTIFTGALLGGITNILFPVLHVDTFAWGVFFIYIPIIGIWYSIIKYKMLSITPEYVSDYIFKAVNEPIFFLEEDFSIKSFNKSAEIITKYDNLQEMNFCQLIEEKNLNLEKLFEVNAINDLEVNLVKKDNEIIECVLSARVVYDDFKDILGIVVILYDISERKKAERILKDYNIRLENKVRERTLRLEKSNKTLQKEILDRKLAEEKITYMVYNDILTGLPNKLYFEKHIKNIIEKHDKDKGHFAIMFLDIDNFKLVNDTLGHPKGDELLKKFADRMKTIIDKNNLLARVGGDEFLLLIDDIEDEDTKHIDNVFLKMNNVLKEPFIIDNKEQFITVSIGTAFYPNDGENVEIMIRNADTAMYEAKNSGKNNLKFFSSEANLKLTERIAMRNNLYRALEKDEFEVHYQPQVNIRTNKIVGFEALLRWTCNGQKISPGKFIPVAEDTGLIVPIGYNVIKSACTTIKRLNSMGKDRFTVAVNLSVNQLYEKDFVEKVDEILEEVQMCPEYLEFEITERIALKGNKDVFTTLNNLRDMGIKISIDDFGTEYSSLMNIKKIDIDKIKIDMQFIRGVTEQEKDAAIVSSIIDLSHNVGVTVIAEGVEKREQLNYLKMKRCDEVQGFFYYKPMPEREIYKIIENSVKYK